MIEWHVSPRSNFTRKKMRQAVRDQKKLRKWLNHWGRRDEGIKLMLELSRINGAVFELVEIPLGDLYF